MATTTIVETTQAQPVATRPKSSAHVNVDTIQPAERDVLSLTHSQESLSKLCDALTPFVPLMRSTRAGFRGDSVAGAISVRVALVAAIYYPALIVPGVLTTIAYVMKVERAKLERATARSRGEDASGVVPDEKLSITSRDVTLTAEALAKAFERFASIAEWRSRVVSTATVYFALTMAVLSLLVPAQSMMMWLALYVTRPAYMRVIPDPFTAAWTRLPNHSRAATNIQ